MVRAKEVLKRDALSEHFTKEITHNNKQYLQNWRRYYFSVPINHGLSRTTDVLPADVPVVLRFHRAPASFALMKMKNAVELTEKGTQNKVSVNYNYEENVIPIKNPVLHAYYAYSNELEQKMSKVKLYNLEIPFLDYVARRTVLDSGLSDYDIDLIQGKLPKYIIFGLSSLDRLSGDETKSITKFIQGDLISFDLVLGNFIFKFKIN